MTARNRPAFQEISDRTEISRSHKALRPRKLGEFWSLAAEARLVADHGTGAALALQAVAHGDARWFTLNRKVKLPAAAGRASGDHGSAPWLSMGGV
jgi:hypothetical protein